MIPQYRTPVFAETTTPLIPATALTGAAMRGSALARPVPLTPPPLASPPDAEPDGTPTTTDVLAPAIRSATVADLHRDHPHALCWWGEATRQWWTYLVLGADRALISANSPYRLADRITEMTTKALEGA